MTPIQAARHKAPFAHPMTNDQRMREHDTLQKLAIILCTLGTRFNNTGDARNPHCELVMRTGTSLELEIKAQFDFAPGTSPQQRNNNLWSGVSLEARFVNDREETAAQLLKAHSGINNFQGLDPLSLPHMVETFHITHFAPGTWSDTVLTLGRSLQALRHMTPDAAKQPQPVRHHPT